VAKALGITLNFRVFLFATTDRLVVTDIDGTITDHEVRGHVLPRLGINADREQVVELFHRVADAGYKLIYLTAR
jgi:phosphatidate phosphatase LPIN